MVGRPPWSQPGTQGGGQTVAVNTRPTVKQINKNSSTTVSAGNTELTEFYAPAGAVWQPRTAFLNAPAPNSATTGDHSFDLRNRGISVMLGESNYGVGLSWNWSTWTSADKTKFPANEAAAVEALQSLIATENSPIEIYYDNETDVDQTNTRNQILVFKEDSY